MVDGDEEGEGEAVGTPHEDGEEEVGTPAQEGEDEEDDADSSPQITSIPRRRRGRGRGAARYSSRRGEFDTPERDGDETGDAGTPFRRKRGRPVGSGSGRGRGGFRGRRKGQQPEAPRVVDKDGTVLDVEGDESVVDNDEEGNEKVDELGNLQGGREYRVRTFKIIGRGERLYMLSTEPARCCGFRDSYLFFARHPKLYKVLVNEEEKRDLIDRDILPSSYKGRNIGVVTARSVFREFGARIIVAGKRVTDDYKVSEARTNGEVEGELADPEDRVPEDGGSYNRNRYVAWFGASEVYRNAGQGAQQAAGKAVVGKRRNNLTVTNWQFVHAGEARCVSSLLPVDRGVRIMNMLTFSRSRSNSAMTELRRANLNGVYDTHTNMMFYPKIMQPTHARWEQVPPTLTPAEAEQKQLADAELPNGHPPLSNGIATDEDEMDIEPSRPTSSTNYPPDPQHPGPTLFSPVSAPISRTFTVIDTLFTSPPLSNTGYPGPDGSIADPSSGPNGLSSISDELVDELPEDCGRAFEEARAKEMAWKRGWGGERESGCRVQGGLKIGMSGWPV